MNILIIGNGGREYAIAFSLRKDKRVKDIFFSPNNAGASIFLQTKHFDYKTNDYLLEQIKTNNISLVIIGPETPLIEGVQEFLQSKNIKVFAPSIACAKLEGQKCFMKDFLHKYNIPTAKYIQTDDLQKACQFIDSNSLPIVLKASGLCGGKGVLIEHSKEQAKIDAKKILSLELFGEAGRSIVVEEFLDGYELSVFCISDGSNYKILPVAQDHKRLLDNDEGPNTGGMGAYSPVPLEFYNKDLEEKIKNKIFTPTLNALKNEGTPYKGVLFAGIMVVKNEPFLLEYNVRFGDPEAEVIIPSLKTPLLDIILSVIDGKLIDIEVDSKSRVCVVLASKSYPYSDDAPTKISITPFSPSLGYVIFANTILDSNTLYANKGRVALALGEGEDIKQARDNAYSIASLVNFEGKHQRSDIAYRAIKA